MKDIHTVMQCNVYYQHQRTHGASKTSYHHVAISYFFTAVPVAADFVFLCRMTAQSIAMNVAHHKYSSYLTTDYPSIVIRMIRLRKQYKPRSNCF